MLYSTSPHSSQISIICALVKKLHARLASSDYIQPGGDFKGFCTGNNTTTTLNHSAYTNMYRNLAERHTILDTYSTTILTFSCIRLLEVMMSLFFPLSSEIRTFACSQTAVNLFTRFKWLPRCILRFSAFTRDRPAHSSVIGPSPPPCCS